MLQNATDVNSYLGSGASEILGELQQPHFGGFGKPPYGFPSKNFGCTLGKRCP